MGFENKFSFSFSQHQGFESCPRQWWLKKVGSWQGWNRGGTPAQRTAYRLKHMTGIYGLAGKVVHEVAFKAVRGMSPERAVEFYERTMRFRYKEALAEAAIDESTDPKRKTNLRELFYENTGIDNLDAFVSAAFTRGRRCVENLFASEPLHAVLNGGEVVEAEELRAVDVAGVPMWVVLDLSYNRDGLVWVWDWKTGRPKDDDRRQMVLYVIYLMSEHGVKLENIRAGLSYLLEGDDRIVEVTQDDIDEIESQVAASAESIRSKLPNPALCDSPAELFPKTNDLDICRQCEMLLACKGHRDLSRPDLEVEA